MTPRLTASLHALTQAARKGMPMPELEMHLEQITDEVENLQARAGFKDVISGLVHEAESEGAKKSIQNLAGIRNVPKVEMRGNPKWAVGQQASRIADRAIADIEGAVVMDLCGFAELAKIARKMAEQEKEWALEIAKIADAMPETN